MKHTFSIFEAKARLSEIIRIAQNQHEVIITDRSKPVVRVVPFKEKGKGDGILARVEELTRLGQLSKPHPEIQEQKQHKLPKGIIELFLKERE
jgi:prevent-host-death family protein